MNEKNELYINKECMKKREIVCRRRESK